MQTIFHAVHKIKEMRQIEADNIDKYTLKAISADNKDILKYWEKKVDISYNILYKLDELLDYIEKGGN